MVTVVLTGGLGNQMFQYAAARALSVRLNTPLSLDTHVLSKKTQMTARHFELDVFNIEPNHISKFKNKHLFKALPFIKKHRLTFLKFGVFTDERTMLYQSEFKDWKKKNTTFIGYFQNEQYFKQIEDTIRKDFTFRNPLEGKNAEIIEQLKTSESVAVHIRRGDYISNKQAASSFVTCGKDYYDKAIKHITNKIENPKFYIFSEDFEWIEENLDFGEYEFQYIDWNKGDKSYIDLQLMSECKHNIIANSSFSWWAAWLNSHSNKIVLAPSEWFQGGSIKNQILDDFYPKGWIKT